LSRAPTFSWWTSRTTFRRETFERRSISWVERGAGFPRERRTWWWWTRAFADVEPGALVGFVGSGGLLEIAVRDGSAATRPGVGVGAEVRAE